MKYVNKEEWISEIRKSSELFIREFKTIPEYDRGQRRGYGERTPYENLAYQIGWLSLIQKWDQDEREGRRVELPARGVQWNHLGPLHDRFYATYKKYSMHELQVLFAQEVEGICCWLEDLEDAQLYQPGGRRWAAATPSDGTVWRWVHTNTVVAFTAFAEKIKKWKERGAAR